MQAPQRPPERIAPVFVILIFANVAAWAWAFQLFAQEPALLGTALLAWVFGLRHAFDADHIAAIDNSVRQLMRDGRPASKAGLFFALGHSTVVVIAAIAVAAFASALHASDEVKHAGSFFGAAGSSLFLLVIGIANLLILRDVWREFRHVRNGGTLSDGTEQIGGGLISRLLRPAMGLVRRSWHLAPLGFLFGLGFDTATEVGLLGLSATEAARGLSPWHTLVFPALFTAGMTLMDTADSALMVGAYGWALRNPLRKLWYNLTITAASVAVALFIGGLGALGLVVDEFQLEGLPWTLVGQLHDDMANFGLVVVGIFVASWLLSAVIYRWQGYDKRPTA